MPHDNQPATAPRPAGFFMARIGVERYQRIASGQQKAPACLALTPGNGSMEKKSASSHQLSTWAGGVMVNVNC
jgi:hypothetical protein